MRIGFRLGRKPSGGMSAFVRNLGGALESLGHQVTCIYMGDRWPELDGDHVEFGAKNQLDEYRLDANPVGKWCDENSIDVLLCPGNQASRTNGRTVWWPLTVAPFEQMAFAAVAQGRSGRARWHAIRRSLELSARVSDSITFSSNYASELYRASIDAVNSKPVTVIHPTTSIPIRVREPDESPRYLLTVSNFNRYKFAVEMVEAFYKSSCFGAGWSFKLVGNFPIPAYESVVREAIARGNSSAIELLGPKSADELADLYAGASGFAFASISENAASYTVIDALAYGLPTVASFYSSTPEILSNAVRYADPHSVDDIADNLSSLVDPVESQRLSRLSLQRAEHFPTWTTIGSELVRFAESSLVT